MGLEEFGKKADQKIAEGKEEAKKVEGEFNGLSKTSKYIIYGIAIIAVLGLGSCMLKGCGKKEVTAKDVAKEVVAQQQAQGVPVGTPGNVQPQVIVQQGSGASDMIAGAAVGYAIGSMMSNGQTYNGSNWQGPPPAGYQVDPKTHAVYKTSNTVNTPQAPVKATTAPVPTVTAKVKNPGDAQAELEAKKMKAEADAKAQASAQAAQAEQKRQADLKARKASLYKARDTSKKSGFNTMSKTASTKKK